MKYASLLVLTTGLIACSSPSEGDSSPEATDNQEGAQGSGGSGAVGDGDGDQAAQPVTVGTGGDGALGSVPSPGSCSSAASLYESTSSMSSNHGATICGGSLRVAVFGDSNWEGGQIVAKLSQLKPEWEFVNIAQGGSGKTLNHMLTLNPAPEQRIAPENGGPFDVMLLGVGTNDGRCNAGAPCTSDPFPAGVSGDKNGDLSWCHSGQTNASTTNITGILDYLIDKVLDTDPNVVPVVVGPAPTWNPTDPGSIYCPGCGCGYGYGSSAFMGDLTSSFVDAMSMYDHGDVPVAVPVVDIHTPLLAMSDAGDPTISAASVDGVHYSQDDAAVTIVAQEILSVLESSVVQ